jgi:D-alanine-D-alanine ligase
VAVVRNGRSNGVIGRLGAGSARVYGRRSVRRIARGLRAAGHTVKVVEGDISLLSELSGFIPPHPATGEPGGIALNLAHGIQGNDPYAHVPAMLEMSGVAYTGPTPRSHAVTQDKVLARTLLREAGIPTPAFRVLAGAPHADLDLRYPLIVGPRCGPSQTSRTAQNRQQLEDAVRAVVRRHGEPVVVEESIAGREIHVALLGNHPVECLPLVEPRSANGKRACPAPLDAAVAERVREAALEAFRVCGCRDYARVAIRLKKSGKPYVVEVDNLGVLERNGSFELAAETAGYSFSDLVCRIVEVARDRYLPARA